MDPSSPTPERKPKSPIPQWPFPIWYIPLALLLLWFWQSMIVQFAYKTIPYSEFKQHLRNGEVKECIVKENSIEGAILPRLQPATLNQVSPGTTNPAASS